MPIRTLYLSHTQAQIFNRRLSPLLRGFFLSLLGDKLSTVHFFTNMFTPIRMICKFIIKVLDNSSVVVCARICKVLYETVTKIVNSFLAVPVH